MRTQPTGPTDEQTMLDGDKAWAGVNLRMAPDRLDAGMASESVNVRYRAGVAETRLGCIFPHWCNLVAGGAVTNWGKVWGRGRFRDPGTDVDVLVIANPAGLWACIQFNAAIPLSVPLGTVIDGPVSFTQCFDRMVMHQGKVKAPLVMEDLALGFRAVTQSIAGDGTQPMPKADRSIFFGNRLIMVHGEDEGAVSDLLDYTRYAPTLQEFRINQGSNDRLLLVCKFNENTLIFFKEQSIYAVSNVYGDLSQRRLDEITHEYGLVAPMSVAQVGADLFFLAQMGVCSIKQTAENRIQGVTQPISEPIQPVIDRINWRYAAGAVAAYFDNKFYLAVPLDQAEIEHDEILIAGNSQVKYIGGTTYVVGVELGKNYRWVMGASEVSIVNGATTITTSGDFVAAGTTVTLNGTGAGALVTATLTRVDKGVNNALLVYDFLNQAWAGYDTCAGHSFDDLFIFPYLGRDRLHFVTTNGKIGVLEVDYVDHKAVPYVELVVLTQPATGDTLQVNGGTTVTADTAATTNAGSTWAASAAKHVENLWLDDSGNPGFARKTGFWTAPGTIPVPTAEGVRWYSTTGQPPSITATGEWFLLESSTSQAIPMAWATRGFPRPDGSLAAVDFVGMDLETWYPRMAISLKGSGYNESQDVEDNITRSRVKYYEPHTKADYDATNAAGGFSDPHREDYSVGIGSGTGYQPGIVTDGGVDFSAHQLRRYERHVSEPMKDKGPRVRLTTERGRVRIHAAWVETRPRPSRNAMRR